MPPDSTEQTESKEKPEEQRSVADTLFFRTLNQKGIKAAKRLVGLREALLSLIGFVLNKEKLDAYRKQLDDWREYLTAAEQAGEIEEQIRFFLDLWQDPSDASQHYRQIGIETGSGLLQAAEECMDQFPELKLKDTDRLSSKLEEIRAACSEAPDSANK